MEYNARPVKFMIAVNLLGVGIFLVNLGLNQNKLC